MTLQVEGTNDSSCLSKYSATRRGFFCDDFLQYFVSKCPRRAPLIHLGYSVRAAIINTLIEEFVDLESHKKQIVSLGAGFDTLYFKLKNKNKSIVVKYFEFDLPRVIERKIKCIQSSDELKNIIKEFTVNKDGLCSKDYKLLAVDLRDVKALSELLQKYELDPEAPTLFLSECAITYLEEDKSTELIKFASGLKNATFVTYEQLHPNDGFGQVMVHHFASLHSPLLSVGRYPTLDLQTQRYIQNDWHNCSSLSALEAYKTVISEEERSRVLGLEPFDEWEELYLKCLHYAVIIASKGSISKWSKLCHAKVGQKESHETQELTWKMMKVENICRYGHSLILSNNQYVIIGGFGVRKDGTHGRMKDILWLKQDLCNPSVSKVVELAEFATMYSTWSLWSEGRYIVYGGRSSPISCVFQCPQVVMFPPDGEIVCEPLVVSCDMPGRWRHSTVTTVKDGVQVFIVFGGRTSSLQLLNDVWMITLHEQLKERKIIEVVDAGLRKPCPRFSHTASIRSSKYSISEMWVCGGLGDSGLLSDVWCLDVASVQWRQLTVTGGSIARFGHSASIHGDSLVMVGGVTDCGSGQAPVSVLHLDSGFIVHYTLPMMSPENSLLLINHSHTVSRDGREIWIVGGGGNCFSFGTFFNTDIAVIQLKDINL